MDMFEFEDFDTFDDTFENFAVQMEDQRNLEKYGRDAAGAAFYHGVTESGNSVVFKSVRVLQHIRAIPTIKVAIGGISKHPIPTEVGQVYTIFYCEHKSAFPIAFFLMKNRRADHYAEVFEIVRELLGPTIVSHIMANFEDAAREPISKVFPEATLLGCWFDYMMRIRHKAQQLKLFNVGNYIKKIQHLTLLPAAYVHFGFEGIIADFMNQHPELEQNINRLDLYWQRQWSAKNISVHGEDRTNNLVKGFHIYLRIIANEIDVNFWKFIDHLITIENDMACKLTRMAVGRERAPRPRRDVEARANKIRHAEYVFDANRNVEQFLNFMVTDNLYEFRERIPPALPVPAPSPIWRPF